MSSIKSLKSPAFFYYLSLISVVLLSIFILSGIIYSPIGLHIYFNSDSLYLPSLYKDLFLDNHKLEGWQLHPAPNFFPDMLFFFILMFVTNDFVLSAFLFSITQVLVVLLLINVLLKSVLPGITYGALTLANLLMSLFLLVSTLAIDFSFAFYLISNSYHSGAFIMGIICLIITFRYLKSKSKKLLVLLFITGLLATVSDRLFLILFSLPVMSLLAFTFRKNFRSRIFAVLAVTILFSLAGIYCFHLINTSNYVLIVSPHHILDFSDIKNSYAILKEQMGTYLFEGNLKSVILILSLLSFFIISYIALRSFRRYHQIQKPDFQHLAIAFYAVFVVTYSIIVFIAPVINGSYTGWDTLRYNIYVFYFLLFSYAFIVSYIPLKKTIAIPVLKALPYLGTAALIIYMLLLHKENNLFTSVDKFLNYYPPQVKCIDSLAEQHNLKYGVANFWVAKHTTMFSKKNVRIYAVFEDIVPYYHATNTNWFYGTTNGKFSGNTFDFIVINNFSDKTRFTKYLTTPIDTFQGCDVEIVKMRKFSFERSTIRPFLVE